MNVHEMVLEIYDEIVSLRRDIHAHPEIGMDTVETCNKVCKKLDEYDIPYRRTSMNGVIVDIDGKRGRKRVMIRGDMDALNQKEETGLDYSSKFEGRMHACGHDIHTSMLVGTAIILNKLKEEFEGSVRLIFQPGEEVSKGATHMIESGAMDGVDMGLGIHVDPLSKVGSIGVRRGADWAAVDHFILKVKGKGAHGATPHDGIDAITCAAAIITNLQMLVSRECDPMKSLVITIGKIQGGSSYNIICDEVLLEGTCRSFDKDIYDNLPEAFDRVVKNICAAYKCEAEIDFRRMAKPLINDDEAYDVLKESIDNVGLESFEASQAMIGEDFSEYCEKAKCVFAHLGSDGGYPLHSPLVDFKEEAIIKGIELEVDFALNYLNK